MLPSATPLSGTAMHGNRVLIIEDDDGTADEETVETLADEE